jgi:hypothetical protein
LIQQGFDQNPKVSSASRGCIAGNTSCAGPSSLKVGNTPKNVLAFYKGVEEVRRVLHFALHHSESILRSILNLFSPLLM